MDFRIECCLGGLLSDISEYFGVLSPLLAIQRLAVLATSQDGQPYSSLVAFAVTDDLKQILFVTNRDTRKYRNIQQNSRVAMLVDSRKNDHADFETASAVTAIGVAREALGQERNHLSEVYLAKHPYLTDFLGMSNSALVLVAVSEYVIAGFDNAHRILV
jgi:heme iron utilization protein